MRLLFVIDSRSPIALNWIQYFLNGDHEVHVVSTFPASPVDGLTSFRTVPVAFSALKSKPDPQKSNRSGLNMAVQIRTRIRQWLGPLTVQAAAVSLRSIIAEIKPDLIHAMRIPYEGMLAVQAVQNETASNQARYQFQGPLLVSVWGNDFTLHAVSTPLMNQLTRRTMQQASALHTDCLRDQRLASSWGFDPNKPALVAPGGGGIQLDLFYSNAQQTTAPVIINPRGFRAYVNNKAFFKAAALVSNRLSEARFFCPGMENEPQAGKWLHEYGISSQVTLLPAQNRAQMAELFRSARLSVSPSNHDGTPNTLLEAMASGCLPVAGDLESIREWITDQDNGLLMDPNDPAGIAQAIVRGLSDDDLLKRARDRNTQIIARRAEYSAVMKRVQDYYRTLIR